ncbi:MAG: hypothetical protein MRZ37_01870 [Tenericutes bacterium]|nr:hypothetical protein [Mycoplasmatota bacterium]
MYENELKEERKSKRIYYGAIIITFVIMLSITVTYAWFASQVGNNPNLVTVGTLQIEYNQGSYINANNLKPATTSQVLEAYTDGSCVYKGDREQGYTNEKICAYNTFTITNTGNLYAKTDISIKNVVNTYSSNIKYMLFETTPEELVANNLKGAIVLEKDILIPPKTNNSKTYTLLIWLDENADNSDMNKEYNGNIYAEAVETNAPIEPNAPVLAEGMIPITYDGTNWVKADTNNTNNNWYNYDNKMWANAVMVSSATRNTYMTADIGTPVQEADILAYYVWIPRYKYKLFNATYASGTSSQVIDVTFENETSTTGNVTCTYNTDGAESCQNKSNRNWYTHPAFTMINASGNKTELKGIWVGKFETTGSTTTPTVKPGVQSLRSITVANMYSAGKLFRSTDYITSNGINQSDSHMMKNIEWGAVAYLKQSNYGLGITDIGINSGGTITGGGTGTSYTTNTSQSTTGNITGVYDMSGGAWEYVMGNYAKTNGSSGLTVSGVPAEHIDIYSGDDVSASHLGDALGETAGWYSDDAFFVISSNPWFLRGGCHYNGDNAGVFLFGLGTGEAIGNAGFRVVLSVTGA